jgi:hypothetical protein
VLLAIVSACHRRTSELKSFALCLLGHTHPPHSGAFGPSEAIRLCRVATVRFAFLVRVCGTALLFRTLIYLIAEYGLFCVWQRRVERDRMCIELRYSTWAPAGAGNQVRLFRVARMSA